MNDAVDVSEGGLRTVLGLPPAPDAAMEESTMMDDGAKVTKAESADAPVKGKGGKGTKAPKPKKEAAAKVEKAPKEKKPRVKEQFDGELVVFAFRLGLHDRDRIHRASGPAGATKFVRAAALAAASGDHDAFKALVDQARANLK